jgi:hypothetical protein
MTVYTCFGLVAAESGMKTANGGHVAFFVVADVKNYRHLRRLVEPLFPYSVAK